MNTHSQKHFEQTTLGFSNSPEGHPQVTLTFHHLYVIESSAVAIRLGPPSERDPSKRTLIVRKFDNWNRVPDLTTHEPGKRSVLKLAVLLEDQIREYLESDPNSDLVPEVLTERQQRMLDTIKYAAGLIPRPKFLPNTAVLPIDAPQKRRYSTSSASSPKAPEYDPPPPPRPLLPTNLRSLPR